MPLYYLDVRFEGGVVADDEGLEFPDLQAAQQQAVVSLVDCCKVYAASEGLHQLCVEVKDAQRTPLLVAVLTLEVKQLP